MAMQLFPFVQVRGSLEQRREGEVVRGVSSFDGFAIEEDGLSWRVPIGVASDYGVVDEVVWVGNLVEHKAGVGEAPGFVESAESDNSAGSKDVGEEAGADRVGMDLLELGHGRAVFKLERIWVGFDWDVFADVDGFGEGFLEGWWWWDESLEG